MKIGDRIRFFEAESIRGAGSTANREQRPPAARAAAQKSMPHPVSMAFAREPLIQAPSAANATTQQLLQQAPPMARYTPAGAGAQNDKICVFQAVVQQRQVPAPKISPSGNAVPPNRLQGYRRALPPTPTASSTPVASMPGLDYGTLLKIVGLRREQVLINAPSTLSEMNSMGTLQRMTVHNRHLFHAIVQICHRNWESGVMYDEVARSRRYLHTWHCVPSNMVGTVYDLIAKYNEDPEKLRGHLTVAMPPIASNINVIFEELALLRRWLREPNDLSSFINPNGSISEIACETKNLTEGEKDKIKKEFKESLKKEYTALVEQGIKVDRGEIKHDPNRSFINTNRGHDESVKDLIRFDFHMRHFDDDLLQRLFQIYLLSYASHPRQGEEWQREILSLFADIVISDDLFPYVSKKINDSAGIIQKDWERADMRLRKKQSTPIEKINFDQYVINREMIHRGIVEGKIWFQEDGFGRYYNNVYNIKSAWYPATPHSFSQYNGKNTFDTSITKTARSLDLWLKSYT